MLESDPPFAMSGLVRNPGPARRPSPPDYRLLGSEPSRLSEDDFPGDLQSLSWLTSVDVPRLQQMTSGRMDFGITSQNVVLQQTGRKPCAMHTSGAPRATPHVQASVSPNILGLNTVSPHESNISPYVVGGQSSPSLQPQLAPLFPTPSCHTQQIFTITHSTQQQCNPVTIYSTSYGTPAHFPQPRLAPHAAQELHSKQYPKPIYSYSCLIAMALKNSKTGSLPVSEIYGFMKEHFPYFKTAPDGWKNSVRHNLSLNKCFEKVENKASSSSRKGCLWALNPAKIDKMEEEMQKWKRKDPAAIRRSMANPEELDKLITDRPAGCRRPGKLAEAEASMRSHGAAAAQGHLLQVQPQPMRTPSLQSVRLHRQIQPQACLAPDSPAPAQTPPLHALPGVHHSPLPHHLVSRSPDFLNLMTDLSTEVDALDPSIMDFALQGNLWEEEKEDSFNLESLGAFSNSPLALSDCDLAPASLPPAPSASHHSFADLQVTGLYTTYATLDAVSPTQYRGPQGNKPIALL
ncbi:forkhead box protein N4 [Protobothrops mucrosquamatus]|uniref:forkhead box protein N4 n=1 Tax=Protobothrops mucrosquamatus TaxID=103944 RepID=UPI0010FAE1B0|nr:forkhead box protein N4 [Protobothrops mucrosquamatus]